MSAWIRLLRPRQWIKNLFVLAPLFFSGQFARADGWQLALLAAACFTAAACVVYIGNDLRDMAEDKLHPVKQKRPLAAGEIAPLQAVLLACLLASSSLFMLLMLPPTCAVILLLYVALNLAYTLHLKHLALIDVFTLSAFYVLRVLMGCYALDVTASPWIILTTFLLALFLGFGKRYHEMGIEAYACAKPNLQHYNRALLDRLMMIAAAAALITYAIYSVEIAKPGMVYSVAFVAFGLFRYMQAVYVKDAGGEPESVILRDRLQLANIALWLVFTLWFL